MLFAHWGGTNGWSRYDLTASMIENGSVEIDSFSHNTRDKMVTHDEYTDYFNRSLEEVKDLRFENRSLFIDKTTGAYKHAFKTSEAIYTDKAPFSSILVAPAYLVVDSLVEMDRGRWMEGSISEEPVRLSSGMYWMQLAIVFSASIIPGALLILLLFETCSNYVDRSTAEYAAIIMAVSTPLFVYSANFFGVITAAFFCFLSYWSAEKYLKSKRALYLVAAGLSLALAFSTEYYAVLFIAPLAMYIVLKGVRENFAFFIFGLMIGSIPLFVYNWLTTGNPFVILRLGGAAAPGPVKTVCEVYTACPYGQYFAGFYFDLGRLINNTIRLLFFESRGLLYYSPVLLLSFLGVYDIYSRDRKLLVIFPGAFIIFLVFQALQINWLAGTSFGPRYAVVGLPFLGLPLALGLKKALDRSWIVKSAVLLLVLASVFNTMLAFNFLSADITGETYEENYQSLKPIQPEMRDHLLDQFMENGPRSEVLMKTLGLKNDNGLQYNNAYAQRYVPLDYQNYVLDTRFLPVTVALLMFALYFRGSEGKLKYVVLALLLVSVFTNVDTVSDGETVYSSWHKADADEVRWSEEKPEIYFYRDSVFDGNRIMSVDLRSLNRSRNVSVYFNGERKGTWSVDSRYARYWMLTSPEKGLNKVRFEVEGKCRNIGPVAGNEDSRCAKIGLRNFEIQEIGGKNVYMSENKGNSFGWDNTREILVRKPGNYSVGFEGFAEEAVNLSVYRGNSAVGSTTFDQFPSDYSTRYLELEGFSRIRIEAQCAGECPRIELSDIKVREYREQSENLLYRPGSNWYQKLESESYRWSRGNNSIYIYNYENRSVNKILWVEGRSFHKNRVFEYLWNGKSLGKRMVPSTVYRYVEPAENGLETPLDYSEEDLRSVGTRRENKYGFNVTLKPGENTLEMRSNSSCISMGRVNNNNDVRCGFYGLKSLYLTDNW